MEGKGGVLIRYARRPNSGLVKIRCARQRLAMTAGSRGLPCTKDSVTVHATHVIFYHHEDKVNNVEEGVSD